MHDPATQIRQGLFHALGAYIIWGLLPIYFHLLRDVGALEVLGSRIIWSFVLILSVLAFRGELNDLRAALRPRTLAALSVSGMLIAANWLTYIWAVGHGQIMAASLGYFLNPLVNVLLGVTLLRERLPAVQWVAIVMAGVGVAILAAGAPATLGISLSLAFTFAFYGLVRKLTPVSPLAGLGVETVVLLVPAIIALVWLATGPGLAFGRNTTPTLLMLASGIVTSAPLLLFASAARKLPLVTLGLVQYVAPTLQFIVGMLYGETLSAAQWWSFALIWVGLALFAAHVVRTSRVAVAVRAET
jgi:chloramphenicol-sensitive protein RarD